MKTLKKSLSAWLILALVGLSGLLILGKLAADQVRQNPTSPIYEVQITVTDKARASYGALLRTDMYLIYGYDENGETVVLKNADNRHFGKCNSSDLHQQLRIGGTYVVTVVGARDREHSLYPNILEIQNMEESQ